MLNWCIMVGAMFLFAWSIVRYQPLFETYRGYNIPSYLYVLVGIVLISLVEFLFGVKEPETFAIGASLYCLMSALVLIADAWICYLIYAWKGKNKTK